MKFLIPDLDFHWATWHWLGQVMHDFEAEDQGELSLSVGDYVVVRQVCPLLIWLLLWPDISGKGNCCVMLYIFWWLLGGCSVSW
jgi:hypothetical protein